MKVLEKGKWEMPWSMEVMCAEKECGAKLLVEETDVKAVDYSSPSRYSAVCPVCCETLFVPAASLPLRVRKVADKSKKYSSAWD